MATNGLARPFPDTQAVSPEMCGPGPSQPPPETTDPLCRLLRERALRFAILMDAIRCLAGTPGGRRRDRLVLARRAEVWVRRRDTRWPFSFDNVCDALNIDAERMRRYLLDPTREPIIQRQPPRVAHQPPLHAASRSR